jgi:hypothetical protein
VGFGFPSCAQEKKKQKKKKTETQNGAPGRKAFPE